jgi:hypothetical protein
MQPHGPFVGSQNGPPYTPTAEYDLEQYWRDYKDNLEYVIPNAIDVAKKIPGRTVITADHGQIFSEGIKRALGFTAHPSRLRLPELVTVPWAVFDGPRRDIQAGETTETISETATDNLKDLGYV